MNVYFLSGLGADRRVFQRLVLPARYTPVYLDWIPPQPHESLPHYALRMAAAIDTTTPFALVGLSFGGMLATEIARVLQPVKTVLISSATSASQLPAGTRLLGALRLDRIVPPGWIKTPTRLAYYLQGATDAASRALLRDLLQDTDKDFLLWASRAILEWRNDVVPAGLRRIHGSADRVIPAQRVAPDYIVRGAGHLAVFTHAAEVGQDLLHCLED